MSDKSTRISIYSEYPLASLLLIFSMEDFRLSSGNFPYIFLPDYLMITQCNAEKGLFSVPEAEKKKQCIGLQARTTGKVTFTCRSRCAVERVSAAVAIELQDKIIPSFKDIL